MKEEKRVTQADIDRARVSLKPIVGVSPLVYLPALYGLAALALLFLLLVWPGLRSNGSWLSFEGGPATCAVYLDGAYRGSTARPFFAKAGSYDLKIEKEGYGPSTSRIRVGGRIFGSLFFPRVQRLPYSLAPLDLEANLGRAFSDYASWSLTGKPSALYQVPAVLSEAVADRFDAIRRGGAKIAADSIPLGDFVSDTLAATQSAESGRDGLRAAFLYAAGGSSPLGLAAAARAIAARLGSGPQGAVWLSDLASAKKGSRAADILKRLSTLEPAAVQAGPGPSSQGFKALGPHSYLVFSAGAARLEGQAPSGSLAPYSVRLPSFGIARTEVTRGQWAGFLAANPSWRPENLETLKAKGLVDSGYLAGWGPGESDLPVTGVSWYAAKAYCDWLGKSSEGYLVVLPSEAMWETAARAGLSGPGSLSEKRAVWASKSALGPSPVASLGYSSVGLADLFGNVWEWSSDSYLPYPAFASGKLVGPERSVRGGSWANAADKIDLRSRGGLPPELCTAFLGFRTAIVQR